jgi:hypothetical protein
MIAGGFCSPLEGRQLRCAGDFSLQPKSRFAAGQLLPLAISQSALFFDSRAAGQRQPALLDFKKFCLCDWISGTIGYTPRLGGSEIALLDCRFGSLFRHD